MQIETYTAKDINKIAKLEADKRFGKEEEFLKFITAKRGPEGFWEVVKVIMDRFYNHPLEEVRNDIKSIEAEAKFARENAINDVGATADLSIRRLGIIPDRLLIALNRIYDNDFPMNTKQFQRGFFKRYPKFLCCNKI